MHIIAMYALKWLLTILSILIWFKILSKDYHYNPWIVSARNFKAIASVIVLVGMAKICKRFLAIFVWIFLNCYELQLLEWSFTIPSILFWFKILSKLFTFNKRIVSQSGKNFKAIRSVVYPVGMIQDYECFLAIISFLTLLDST